MVKPLSRVAVIVAVAFGIAVATSGGAAAESPVCGPGTYVSPDDLNVCLPATAGNDYVALAYSPSTGAGGWGTADTQDRANQIAMAQCVASSNSVCQVIAAVHHGCAAYAIDAESGVVQGGTGADGASAAADALRGLPRGVVSAVQCSSV